MKNQDKNQKLSVTFHFGAAHVTIENPSLSTTIAALKETALGELTIQPTPGVAYNLEYKGSTVLDEAQTLSQLVGEHVPAAVEFHLKKVLTGGSWTRQ